MEIGQRYVVFFTGESGSGKTYFLNHFVPQGAFYNLISATTRDQRDDEKDGVDYYFRDEAYFESEKFATLLWVNEPTVPKWEYGVTESEIMNNLWRNFIYVVIQPKYVYEMIKWFHNTSVNGIKLSDVYKFKIIWFQPSKDKMKIIESRKNMQDDAQVRFKNSCNLCDFRRVGLHPNHYVICNPERVYIDPKLHAFLNSSTNTK